MCFNYIKDLAFVADLRNFICECFNYFSIYVRCHMSHFCDKRCHTFDYVKISRREKNHISLHNFEL